MSIPISSLKEVLRAIEEDLSRDSEFLIDSGKSVDDPEYGKQTRRLEALMAQLSLAIKDLQNRPQPLGHDASKALKYARNIEKKLKAASEHALTQNKAEVVRGACESITEYLEKLQELDHIHEYHNSMIEAPVPDLSHVGAKQYLETFEASMVLLFTIIAGYVQKRKRTGGKEIR